MDKNMQSANTTEMSLCDATKPLLVVSRLVGMNPKSHWHKMYTGFILACDFSILCTVWQYHNGRKYKYYPVNILVHILRDMCYLISIFILLGFSLFDQRRFMVPLKDFENVDESLKSLGGCIDNRGTYRLGIFQVIYVGLIIVYFWLMKLGLRIWIELDKQLYRMILMSWFYYLTIIIACAVADCSFSAILSIIRKRFKEINSIICRIGKRGLYLRGHCLEVTRAHTDNDVLRDLKILRKLYHDLWEITNRINDAYGLHLLVGVISSFTLITTKLYEAYITFAKSDAFFIAESTSWVLFYVIRIVILAQVCESTVAEAKVTFMALQNLMMKEDHSPTTKEEIRDFCTQLQYETRNFTAYRFFDVNFTLVCGILGTACTYLVILIQMSDSNASVITSKSNESLHFDGKHNS